jgi:hypothetical protein
MGDEPSDEDAIEAIRRSILAKDGGASGCVNRQLNAHIQL